MEYRRTWKEYRKLVPLWGLWVQIPPSALELNFRKGKTPEQIIKEKVTSKNTAYKYWRRFKLYKELNEKLWKIIIESL